MKIKDKVAVFIDGKLVPVTVNGITDAKGFRGRHYTKVEVVFDDKTTKVLNEFDIYDISDIPAKKP